MKQTTFQPASWNFLYLCVDSAGTDTAANIHHTHAKYSLFNVNRFAALESISKIPVIQRV